MAKAKPRPRNPAAAIPDPDTRQFTHRAQHPLLQSATIFLVALAVRALHLFEMRTSVLYDVLISDARQYDDWAQRIAAGDWLGGREVFYQTPLYPYALAILYATLGHYVWLVRVAQSIGGSLACVFLCRAGSRYFSPASGWISGLLLALYPPAIFFDGILQKSSLDLLLMTLLLWTLATALSQPRAVVFMAAGCLYGALTLNRENAAILLPVLLAWIVGLSWSQPGKTMVIRLVVFVLAAAAVLAPIGLRNWYVGGSFTLTTSQMGSNFYIGNHAGASGTYEAVRSGRGDPRYEREDARLVAEQSLQRSLSAGEVSEFWLQNSWTYIHGDPAGWLRLLSWKWLLTWNSAELIDSESLGAHQRHSLILFLLTPLLHFGILCPLAAVGLWSTRHDWRRLWPLYATLLSFSAAVTFFYVVARYRFPLVPPVALFAGVGLLNIGQWITGRGGLRTREILIGGLLFVTAAAACNWRMPKTFDDEALTYFNAGTSLLELGRVEEAVVLLEQSVALEPRQPATYINLGRAALALGELPQAQHFLQQAIDLSPTDGIACLELARLWEKQGDRAQAIDCLKRAIRCDPLLAPAHQILGNLEFQQGDLAAAVAELRRAVEIEPRAPGALLDLSVALAAQRQFSAAVAELRAALEIEPRAIAVANNLAWILATSPQDSVRNGKEAVTLAEGICRDTEFQQPELLDTLAAALAESGRFDEAVEVCRRAEALAERSRNSQLVETCQRHLVMLMQHRALRDPTDEP